MRRLSSPAEEGKGNMFKAGGPAGTGAQRCHVLWKLWNDPEI